MKIKIKHDLLALRFVCMILVLLWIMVSAATVLAQEESAAAHQEKIKKTIGSNWDKIEPCIDVFAQNHPEATFFVLRLEVEPGQKVGGVFTNPSDEPASECFYNALSTMIFPVVEQEVPFQFRIDIPGRAEPEKVEPEKAETEKPLPTPEPKEEVVKEPIKKKPPMNVPVGRGRMFLVGGDVIGAVKLKSFLLKHDVSMIPARRSRANTVAGWAMQIMGPLLNLSGVILLSFGVNALINDIDVSWDKAFTIAGACMLVAGIAFDIVGNILISRGWSYLAAAIRVYNASDPEVPVYPAGY